MSKVKSKVKLRLTLNYDSGSLLKTSCCSMSFPAVQMLWY